MLQLAVTISREFGVDPALMCSHVDTRTRWHSGFANPTAISYLTHQNFPDPMESEYRSIQWGLMAIGGEFARAEGYLRPLPELLEPSRNLREGCRLFLRLMATRSEPVAAAVEALTGWNRENNRERAAETLSKIEAYRELIQRIDEAPRTFQDASTILPPEYLPLGDNPLLEIGESEPTRSQP